MNFAARPCFGCLGLFRFIAILAVASLAFSESGMGQATSTLATDPQVDTGTRSSGSYSGVHENVSLTNGNLSFCIPLLSLPGRHKHDVNIPLCYNSQFKQPVVGGLIDVVSWFPWVWGSSTAPMGPGWTLTGRTGLYSISSSSSPPIALSPNAGVHNFPSTANYGPDGQSANMWNNGNGLYLEDGTLITPGHGGPGYNSNLVSDSNGNVIDYESSYITDTVGRTVNVIASNAAGSSPASISFQYPDSNGVTRTVTVQMSTHTYSISTCSDGSGGMDGANGTYAMPSAVILPNGLTYTLQYNGCGLLTEITYPNGAYTRYAYTQLQMAVYMEGSVGGTYFNQLSAKYECPVPAVALGATSAPSGDTCPVAERTTTYNPTVNSNLFNNSQNVVTDPLGNKTVYQFSQPQPQEPWGVPAVETSRQIYQGSSTLLRTVITQYTATSGNAVPALPTIQTTTLENGMVSKIQWTYDLHMAASMDSVLTEKREYDFGSGAPGPLLRRTDYTWLQRDNPAYGIDYTGYATNPAHILDRKTSEIIYDGSGNLVAQTRYVYDNNAPGTYGARGNLTSVSRWNSTNGAWLTTSYAYDSYGNTISKTDPKGNVTTYSYADNYADGVNRSSNAFLTMTTYPSVNGVSHVAKSQYYWGSGLIAASCGENYSGTCTVGQSAKADYASYTYDLMGRKISATTGDGGQSTTCYSEVPGSSCYTGTYPLQVTSSELISSGVTKVSTAISTRPVLGVPTSTTELTSDPSCSGGTVNVDKTYDLVGRVSTVSNPYCSGNASAATSGLTTYAYDALDRTTQITHPDGSYAINTYTGRGVLSADEGNGTTRIQRISQTDGLGRLAYVCEISGTTQQGTSNTPVSCGLDSAGTGFLTSYTYNALGNLTSVTQGGVSRGFTYNTLSQLLSATNPESGTTTYAYDADGNLTSKTDALGKTITYSYDSLNRLTSKSYSDGTASACFQYDQNSGAHGVGRLTTEWTQAGACSSTPSASGVLTQRTFAFYDLLGRVTNDQQCSSPGNCTSSTPYSLSYGYDLAGNVTQFTNGLTATPAVSLMSFATQYNAAGRLSLVNGSESSSEPSNMTPLFTATGYSPAGSLTDSVIGAGITFHRDYNNRLLPIDEKDTVGTTPGTATVQITGTEQISAYSTGTFTFTGAEQSTTSNGTTIYDAGTFMVLAFGAGVQPIYVTYGSTDTPQTLATKLAAGISCATTGGRVQSVANGATVYLVSCQTGTATDYALTGQLVVYNINGTSFAKASFAIAASGATMTPVLTSTAIGGTNTGSTYPTGSIPDQITISGSAIAGESGAYSVLFYSGPQSVVQAGAISWTPTSTPTSIASSFAASFPPCSSSGALFSVTSSGPVVSLANCTAGTNYTVELLHEAGTAFTASLSNNTAPPPVVDINVPAAIYDRGTATLSVNGTQIAATSYVSGATPASIVSGLVSASYNNGMVTLQASASNTSNLVITAVDEAAALNYSYTLDFTYDATDFSAPSFAASSASGTLTGEQNAPLYNWSISSYAPDGDVLAMTDSVMGGWTYTYDDFNRLTSGTAASGVDEGLTLSWTYDRYGNRWAQNVTGTGNSSAVSPQLTFTGNNNRIDGWSYDAAGNLLYDYIHHYTYDAENRIATIDGASAYRYDAEGRRVAKTNSSGAATSIYVLGLGGEQVSEVNGSGVWVHSNVFVGGRLMATYEGPGGTAKLGYHYHLTDWLGTQRMQTTANGNQEEVCYSYPFGDGLSCTGTDATEHHFTSKERDAESGLDYFGARYLSSNLGRFMTPDWAAAPTAVPYASYGDPQSLNLYVYGGNNPNTAIDLDGHVIGLSGFEDHGDGSAGGDEEGQESAPPSNPSSSSNSGSGSDGTSSSAAATPAPKDPPVKNPDPTAQQQNASGNAVQKPDHFTFNPNSPSNGTLECAGQGRGLEGNANLAGKQGGIPGQLVQLDTAAVTPKQFGVNSGAALAPYAGSIHGTIGGASFSSITDVNGGKPISGMNVRDYLQQKFPGQLIIEIPGARDQGSHAPVTIFVPRPLNCPTGTYPAGGIAF